MRSFFICALALFCTVAAVTPNSQGGKSYIIKLKPQVNQVRLLNFINEANRVNAEKVAKITYRYKPDFFNGFAGVFNQAFLQDLRRQHGQDIEFIEEDGIMTIVAEGEKKKQTGDVPWGLKRVSQRKANETDAYLYHNTGKGVNVFVVDTGILTTHPDFEGRAVFSASFVTGEDKVDLNGHGTHCAGTIGGTKYGVAKETTVHAVKVLNRFGSGSYSGVIAGIQHVTNSTLPKRVMSMSLGGGKSEAVNQAIDAAVASGVVAIVAAGNERSDACTRSPASAAGAFAVGATDISDNLASFSNFGSCVKIHAPGVNVNSAWLKNSNNTISGTSMACPHVAGVAALYLSSDISLPTPTDVYKALQDHASPSKDNRTIVYNDINDPIPSRK